MNDILKKCELCPRLCRVDRYEHVGYCGCSNQILAANAMLHFWEEPPISGINGSGAIFFSGCTLKCVYCQNRQLSHEHYGKIVSEERLAEIMLSLQEQKAHNINLVSPTQFVPQIISSINIARKHGLKIPVVYNTGGYERVETIKLLHGYADIYLTDIKYFDDSICEKYSHAKDYFLHALNAVKAMIESVGECEFDDSGMMRKGVIIRHLVLPNLKNDSKKILSVLKDEIDISKVKLSLMSQFTPDFTEDKFKELKRKITTLEYQSVVDYAYELGFEGYMQDKTSASDKFVPEFNINTL